MKFLPVALLFTFFFLQSFAAQAGPHIYPMRFSPTKITPDKIKAAGAGKLLYYGGPVISNAKTYVVFWGSNVVSDTKAGIGDFYSAISNSNHMDWLDQYNTTGKSLDGRDGTNQHLGRGQYAGSFTIQPASNQTSIDDSAIQAELQRQMDSGVLPKADTNTLYMIYFPPGVTITIEGMASCSDFCAYHNAKGTPASDHFYYGVMPDLGGSCAWGCGFNQHFANVTAISAHEYMEAITDPFPTPGNSPAYPQAWNDTQGSEIGDLCAGTNNTLTVASTHKSYTVQSEWNNATNSCTANSWQAP